MKMSLGWYDVIWPPSNLYFAMNFAFFYFHENKIDLTNKQAFQMEIQLPPRDGWILITRKKIVVIIYMFSM